MFGVHMLQMGPFSGGFCWIVSFGSRQHLDSKTPVVKKHWIRPSEFCKTPSLASVEPTSLSQNCHVVVRLVASCYHSQSIPLNLSKLKVIQNSKFINPLIDLQNPSILSSVAFFQFLNAADSNNSSRRSIRSNQQPPTGFSALLWANRTQNTHPRGTPRPYGEPGRNRGKPWDEMQKIASSRQPRKHPYMIFCCWPIGLSRLVFFIFWGGEILLWILFAMDHYNLLCNCVVFHPLYTTNNQGPLVTAQRWTDECCPGKEVACHYLFGGMADPLKLYIIPYTFF